jgi:hypothetical protein
MPASRILALARQPLIERRRRHQKGRREPLHRHAANGAQRQRYAHVGRDRRVRAGENQPQPIVGKGIGKSDNFAHGILQQRLAREQCGVARITADGIDDAALGGHIKPARDIGRPPRGRQRDQRRDRIGKAVFGQIKVTAMPGQRANNARPGIFDRASQRHLIGQIGRISIAPLPGTGIIRAHSIAASRSATSTM